MLCCEFLEVSMASHCNILYIRSIHYMLTSAMKVL